MVINNQEERSRLKYHELKSRVSEHIPVYQQEEEQPDIWKLLKGNKDDFFIYDRCGCLVKHIGLPYAFLQFSYVEDAIKSVYCENTCGDCKHQIPDVCKKEEEVPAQDKVEEEPVEALKHRPHHHRHHHRHGHRQREEDTLAGSGPNTNVHRKHDRQQGEGEGDVEDVRVEHLTENRVAESDTSVIRNKL
ncbi:unnamed protein product [Staurois parvus]|uniref:Selenoprotein P N-terminal domain-containing protein n=1 Tax=Staurois parvus TaxID=386267 RepID=A0ABN9CKJ4_9NEOB|nr:unnamed protein product [Staurois parvus]